MNQLFDASTPSDIAIFDFDNTLTSQDSLLPFIQKVVKPLRFYWGLFVLSPILIGYALGWILNWRAKEELLTHFLAGLSEQQLKQFGQRFAAQKIPKLLRSEALKRLLWHQEQGHQTVLVSASLEAYLLPWGKMIGFDYVIGTQLEAKSGVLTGRILGKNCYGQEKVNRLRKVLGDLKQYCIYAYGDSRGDRELLAIANYPYYRTFQKPKVDSKQATSKWERGAILSAIAAAVLYLGIVLWSGAEQFWQTLELLPPWLISALLALVFVGYCFRFWRWQWYLQQMNYQVPLGSSFRIFLASFALTASPGKAGESIKSLLLKRHHSVPVAPTLAGLFCERFTDALSVVLLICLSLFSIVQNQWLIVVVGLVQLVIILVLQQPILIKQLLKPLNKWSKLRSILARIKALIDSTSILLKPRILLGSTLLALVAWSLEGIALYFIFQFLGATSITPYQAVLIHTASGLVGALSLLPGGIGGTEAITISLSILHGATQTTAVAATLLIRLLTLWFAVGVGILAMLLVQKRL
ncbi:HAD-IB family hydrolase [Pleurocapsales cyanobacterium LEGE 10410]|nr:HAD-IB family hydrolase [Pleurocapsales cyanobacterium LEGE 10410]